MFDLSIHVKECTAENCGNEGDCGNKYFDAPSYMSKCVVATQFEDNGKPIKGLKVIEGEFIPAWAVIGEYTGGVMAKKVMNKESRYVVEVSKRTIIDAEKEGNVTRFINHRCKDYNLVFVPVRAGSKDTVFIRSIKPIQGNEFLSIHYGTDYRDFFPVCLCQTCCPEK